MGIDDSRDIFADAITDGKEVILDLVDLLEELADRAQDTGIAIREMALALETLGVENLDEDCGKD